MEFTDIPTEQTTAITDAILALMAMAAAFYLRRIGRQDTWKAALWIWIFSFLALAATLGAIVHGFKIPQAHKILLWYPLYLSLALVVALFSMALVRELWGEALARRILAPGLLAGAGFLAIMLFVYNSFLVFIVYETLAMLFALGGYSYLAYKGRLKGAYLMVLGILLTILAAGVQASKALAFTFIWAFDHNGVYHIIQMLGVLFLAQGLRKTLLYPA